MAVPMRVKLHGVLRQSSLPSARNVVWLVVTAVAPSVVRQPCPARYWARFYGSNPLSNFFDASL
jgi:hypothetical protein